ncbi:MAG: UDP-N-acetylglucosamine 2-epimerase (non-hydrolyzing) [Nevskia sp.]|nr:UDP-N-acetylglucosamine 2-epimerase (non-hydrolyzing) [Nevskia sp.]
MTAAPAIACIVGTRPEAIKMAPVIRALKASCWARCLVVATGQHRDLLDGPLAGFGIVPDIDLDLMTEGQTLTDLTARVIPAVAGALARIKPAAVLAQGDTATVFAAALAAFYARLPFGHVEAGLRTYDLEQPFPEEAFRQMVARITHWHFAPTAGAADNLRGERIAAAAIHVTGNTSIDTLLSSAQQLPEAPVGDERGRLILLTAHRRENFGAPLERIFAAVRELADRYPDIRVLYPVHPNPAVRGTAGRLLGGHARIELCPPLDYFQFVAAMRNCHFVLTDSGGVQEEAPALGKPVLVLREQTERPEAVAAGVAKVVGTSAERIVEESCRLLDDPAYYGSMARGVSPYGDGQAAGRIEAVLRRDLCVPGPVNTAR